MPNLVLEVAVLPCSDLALADEPPQRLPRIALSSSKPVWRLCRGKIRHGRGTSELLPLAQANVPRDLAMSYLDGRWRSIWPILANLFLATTLAPTWISMPQLISCRV